MTYFCAAIFVQDRAQARRDIALAAEAGADMVELRIDTFREREDIAILLKTAQVPIILTRRAKSEGGESDLPDSERLQFLWKNAATTASYFDVELKSYQSLRFADRDSINRPVILSMHDFSGRPDRLYNTIDEMNRTPAAVNKIVWSARSIRDNLEAFELLKTRQKP